ncbi:hypothetical protein PG997_005367 [Apiospora hydei]|uniref:Uncharacterized protein n=1 Tax=Apiospora hydei TaxID=1337664 RepID=A0ABR1X4S3_9PEZI
MVLMTDVPVAQVLGDLADSIAGRNASVSLPGLLGLAGDVLGQGFQSSLEQLSKGFNLTLPPLLSPLGGVRVAVVGVVVKAVVGDCWVKEDSGGSLIS